MSKARTININNERIREAIRKKKDFQLIDNDLRRRINIDCGTTAFAVYMELMSRLNIKTGLCCPSQDEIARSIGIAKRTVVNSLEKLKEKRYIDYVKVKSKTNAFSNNEYYFMYPKQELASEEVEEKKECKIIQMPVARKSPITAPDISKVPPMAAPKYAPMSVNPNKVPPAPLTVQAQAKAEVKPEAKEKVKMPAEIKSLLNEYKSLLNKKNEMTESREGHWKDTCSDAIKHYIEKGDIKSALIVIEPAVQELRDIFYIKENGLERLTYKDVEKVCEAFKEEFTSDFNRKIENYIFLERSAAKIVVEVRNYIEAKGLEFDLDKILVA